MYRSNLNASPGSGEDGARVSRRVRVRHDRHLNSFSGLTLTASQQMLGRLSLIGRGIKSAAVISFVTIWFATILFAAAPAWAVCTQHGSVGASSTQIVTSNDVSNVPNGRHYFFLQNTGSNSMNVAIGSSNSATSSDTLLAAGQAWVMTAQGGALVPGGDVAAISSSGTTYSFCDF
jgi:hypothetical protein